MNAFAIVFTLVAGVIAGNELVTSQYDQSQAKLSYVQTVCDYSRTVVSTSEEQKCGDAQETTHTEYLCDSLTANAHCWVEQK